MWLRRGDLIHTTSKAYHHVSLPTFEALEWRGIYVGTLKFIQTDLQIRFGYGIFPASI
jgi:hypothetical protein